MLHDFDIFERWPDGSPNWVGSVETLGEAKEIVTKLANSNGHFDYFVHDIKLGKEVWAWPIKVSKIQGLQSNVDGKP